MKLVSTSQSPGASLAVPPVVGAGLLVPLATGELIRYANLDHAASSPCLCMVQDAINELLPWYASVHRGVGFASQVSSRVYESARQVLRAFVGAPATDAVVFTRNTTDALNLLAHSLPESTMVVTFDTELSLFGARRVGVVSFAIEGQDPGLLAAALSAEYGIGVREGAFCAHIATSRLLTRAGSAHQRAVRASLGLGNTPEDVERLVDALHALTVRGPRLRYARVGGQWLLESDPRPWPSFAI